VGTTETETAREIVSEYFDALRDQDLDRATATWKPGAPDRMYGFGDLIAPEGIREYFGTIFAAVPDWRFEVLDMVAEGDQVAVRWRAAGTFSGTGKFQGLAPNGRPIDLEGADVLTVEDGKIVSNHAYTNGVVFAQQVGALPPSGSAQERAMAAVFNAKTALAKRLKRR
jgi:predicted ester cyclase